MNQVYQSFVGIDISKASADFHIHPVGTHGKIANTPKGHAQLIAKLPAAGSCIIVLEATGGYELDLLFALQDANHCVALVNPRRTRAFAIAQNQLAKTDRIDAKMIAIFAERSELQLTPKVEENTRKLREMVLRRRQLIVMRTAEKNRYSQSKAGVTHASLKRHLSFLQKEIDRLDRQIEELIQCDPEKNESAQRLTTVPGVGKGTANAIISELPELGRLNQKEIAALVGVAPINRDSGRKTGKRSVHGGRAGLRATLYMAALTAARINPKIKLFAERLRAKGKPGKVILVACIRKLIGILNTMEKTKQNWCDATALTA